MENIKITIAENGTTTLATAGKYCDRNVDVEVNVAGGGGGAEIEPIVLTGECSYACAGVLGGKYIENFGDTVSTIDITDASLMFDYNTAERIPFNINLKEGSAVDMRTMFGNMPNLVIAPNINNAKPEAINHLFTQNYRLRELPVDFGASWDWSTLHTTTAYSGGYIFNRCFSLRKIPEEFTKNLWNYASGTYSNYYYGFYNCIALDEIVNLGVSTRTFTSNCFSSSFSSCRRLANLIFTTNEDGSPIVASWKKQTIDLTTVGYTATDESILLNYNSGITADKLVNDDATYQALKNNPDWYSTMIEYSRYNHDSAVRTINSLPDCSAYLATQTGTSNTNTIKFKGASGALTDGGAINTLTEEEIAVATAKGWSVTLV